MATDLLLDVGLRPVQVLPTDGSSQRGTMRAKVGDSGPQRLHFQQDGALVDAPAGVTAMVLEIRERGDYDDGDPLLRVVDFTSVDPGGGDATYLEYAMTWEGVDLRALLNPAGEDPVGRVQLIGELTWADAAGVSSTEEWEVTVLNDLVKDVEAAAVPLPAVPTMEEWLRARAVRYHPEITALVGGTATELDGIATVDLPVGTAVRVGYLSEIMALGAVVPQVWVYRLVAGTEVAAEPDVVRPADYAGGTNEKIWVLDRVGVRGLSVTGVVSADGGLTAGSLADPAVVAKAALGAGVTAMHVVRTLTDAATIEWANGNCAAVTLGGNRTLAKPSHAPGLLVAPCMVLRLEITQDGTGNRTLGYAAGITFAGGVAPVLSTAAGAVDVLTLVSFDGGTSWRGRLEKGFA